MIGKIKFRFPAVMFAAFCCGRDCLLAAIFFLTLSLLSRKSPPLFFSSVFVVLSVRIFLLLHFIIVTNCSLRSSQLHIDCKAT